MIEFVKKFLPEIISEAFKYGLLVVTLLAWAIWREWRDYHNDQETDKRLTRVEIELKNCNKDKENILMDRSELAKYP